MFLITRSFKSSWFPLLLRHLSDYSYQKHLQIKVKQKQDHDSGGSKGKAGGGGVVTPFLVDRDIFASKGSHITIELVNFLLLKHVNVWPLWLLSSNFCCSLR